MGDKNVVEKVGCKELPLRRLSLPTDSVDAIISRLETLTGEAVENSCVELVLDMSGVCQMDSRGLSALIGLGRTLKRGGGKLVLADLQPDMAKLLNHMRLLEQFEIRNPEPA